MSFPVAVFKHLLILSSLTCLFLTSGLPSLAFASQAPPAGAGWNGLYFPFLPGGGDPTPLYALGLSEMSLIFLPRWQWTPVVRAQVGLGG